MGHDFPDDLDTDTTDVLDQLEFASSAAADITVNRNRLARAVQVTVRPADVIDRQTDELVIRTSEIGDRCVVGFGPEPRMVGSVYHLEFDRSSLDCPSTLAVCDRCTMLSEASFELRFRTITPLGLGRESS